MVVVLRHFCLFLTDSVAAVDIIEPSAIVPCQGVLTLSKALRLIFELDLTYILP